MLFPLSLMSLSVSLLVVILCCFFMAKFRHIYDKIKIPLAIITVIAGLILYTIGYIPADSDERLGIIYAAFRALFSTCRIFILESDFSDLNETVLNNGFFVFSLSLVHVLGAMITIMTILSAFGIKFISRLKLLFGNIRQTYIFLGFNDEALNLIKSLKTGGKYRCFIVVESLQDGEEDGDLLIKLREDRFILIDAVWQDLTGIKKLHIPKRLLNGELHIFALSNDESKNTRVILSLLKQAQKEGMNEDKIKFYLNTTDEYAEKYFEIVNKEKNTNFEVKTFSVPDITARQLFEAYPIHDYLPLDTESAKALSGFTIFIAGLGPVGMEVLRKSIYMGQFVGGDYRAIITDEEMTKKRGFLFNKYPGLKDNYKIETYEAIPGSEEFCQALENNINTVNYIVIALDNDKLNIETAVEIQRLVNRSRTGKKPVIAVHISKDEDYEHLEKSMMLPDVKFFGRYLDIFTESIIINETMDSMARKMNALYNSLYNIEPADNWRHLDAFTKESNRSAASNIATKLRLLNLEMKGKNSNVKRKAVNLAEYLTGERLENLSKQEHLRWNAFHFASGWVTWPLDQVGDTRKAKDTINRRHACLVSWEELEDVTRRFNQTPSYQELDRQQVKNIPVILEHAGYEVYERN
ncbi:MAG: hypothetical protein GX022_08410 [Clostridiaceae bacterium]|nr:hypothetical protein [Clostridiaceae bacterium]